MARTRSLCEVGPKWLNRPSESQSGFEALRTDWLVLERHGLAHPQKEDLPVRPCHLFRRIVLAAPLLQSRLGLSQVERDVWVSRS